MIKEKITALIKKDDKNNKKKIENLIFAFVLLVITLVAINIIFKDDKKTKNISTNVESSENTTDFNTEKDIEERLEKILGQIKGVEDVKVLITYSETEKLVPIYNESSSQSTTEEKDVEGGTRTIESYDNNKEVISDSNQTPITEKIVLPKIEGAIITAKGAENTTVKESIINAVSAATGLATHKIQVFEMK